MKEQTRTAALGLAAVLITGGVLLWATSPGVTLKREYESGNGKPVDGGHVLQEITLPVYNNVRAVTAREACDLQDGILVLAYPRCPYCRNLMPELAAAARIRTQGSIIANSTSTGTSTPTTAKPPRPYW